MSDVEHLAEGVTLILGDNRELLMRDTTPKPSHLCGFDAVVTDPPYGIGASSMSLGKWRTSRMPKSDWDAVRPDLGLILALGVPTIVWGGNYFDLTPANAYLVWNKGAGFKGRDFAECELAWCSFKGNARVFEFDPLAAGSYRDKEHPTQKPVEVMRWCLGFLPDATHVLDPYLGSGSTGVAAVKMGLRFTGIEINPGYFDIACRRIAAALKEPDLFIEAPQPMKQEALPL